MTSVDETMSASAVPTSAFDWLVEIQSATATYEQLSFVIASDGTNFGMQQSHLPSLALPTMSSRR
jgi:hypothetical protein